MKVAVITCYADPDYVRARTIRAAVKADSRNKLIVVKNQHKSWLRYPEIVWKLVQLRRYQKPDVYVLTFRGQEILPIVLLVAGLKPVIFDEFIVPVAYAKNEPHTRSFATSLKHFLARVSEPLYRWWLRQCRAIIADTQAHAELSARISHVNLRQYRVLPVGTDETLFRPVELTKSELVALPFRVFFYGNMLPLHGLWVVLEAAERLGDNADIEFVIIGGKKPVPALIEAVKEHGGRISYLSWLPFEELPEAIHTAAVCLGGPFGGTPQAQHVITGKTYQFLACAAPTIIGESEATEPLFKDKDNALLVPQADADALAHAITWAFKHRSELVDIGRAGRKLYERSFSSEIIAGEVKKLLDEAV